jgi:HK97 family phage portal protein
MNLISRLFGNRAAATEKRSATVKSSDPYLAEFFGERDTASGVPVSAHLAENLSVVFAAVQAISETVATLPVRVYRKLGPGTREEDLAHPVARIFSGDPNERQSATEFLEMVTAHCLLRGNGFAEIIRDVRGAPVGLEPFHPDHVSVVRISRTGRYAYDVSLPAGGTRRLLPEEMLHLKDRTDDGVVGKSRLARARETFGSALATERYAASTFRNGASMSGVLMHPEALDEASTTRLRKSFEETYSGADKAGKVAVLEEGLKWQQVSVSPDDAQMLESRRFSVEALARIYRVPGPIIGDFQGGNYSSISEVGRWFYSHTIMPWLNKWERLIEHAMLSTAARQSYEIEFDCDLLLRGDMLTRFQAYRIAREIGVYNANELRGFEKANRRTDAGGEEYFAPANMQQTQDGRPIADRTPGGPNA